MKAISLFTGAGGLDIGCEAAGFITVAAVESNKTARLTLLENASEFFPLLSEETIFTDILDLDFDELMSASAVERGEVDLLHGGPPCTPFSKSGYWLEYKRKGADPKASLLDSYVEALHRIQPKSFLMENVYGLAYGNQNRPVLMRFLEGVRAAGYAVDRKVLLAADYGVPQLRQRFICVGIRTDLLDVPPDFWQHGWPAPTHSGPHETRSGYDLTLPPHKTASEALAGLDSTGNPRESEEVVNGTFADDLREIPPGDNYLYLTSHRGHPNPRFRWRSRYWTFLLKLHPDRPASTIQGQPGPWVGPFHWENRRLRVAEVKRLMTFPDEFKVIGTRREHQLQLGNAVPPQLGYVVALSIRDALDRLGVIDIPTELAA